MVADIANYRQQFTPQRDAATPQAIDAEESILGALLFDPNAIDRVEGLKPEHFYIGAHRLLFEAIATLHRRNMPTDLTSVAVYLHQQNHLQAVGGQGKLADLFDSVVGTTNVDAWAELVIEKAQRRELIKIGQTLAEMGCDRREWSEVLNDAETMIFTLRQQQHLSEVLNLPDGVVDALGEIERRSKVSDIPLGIPSGFFDLDALTQGWQKGDLIIAAGRASMGKTSFVLNVCRNAAIQSKKHILISSLEMSKQALVYRLLSSESGISSGQLRAGKVGDWDRLIRASESLSGGAIDMVENCRTVEDLRSVVLKISGRQPLDMIVIDYLQLMAGKSGNRVEELSQITRELKALAIELDCPVIALSQISRGVESRDNKRPMMSDLRESGSIEQEADLIIMLYRDDYYNENSPDRGIAELIIRKHRNGALGTAKVLFDASTTLFKNMAVRHG